MSLRFTLSHWPSHRLLTCSSHCDEQWKMLGLPCLCPTLSTRYRSLSSSPRPHEEAFCLNSSDAVCQSGRTEMVWTASKGPSLDVQGPGSVSELISQQLQFRRGPASLQMLGACSGGGDVATEASASAVQSLLSQAAGTAQVIPQLLPHTSYCILLRDTCLGWIALPSPSWWLFCSRWSWCARARQACGRRWTCWSKFKQFLLRVTGGM